MGALLLCSGPIAAMPYYIEALSLNIYSLEELCYVIEHHLFLIDEEFLGEELIVWLEQETGNIELAENLRQARKKKLSVTSLAELIFKSAGYLDYETEVKVIRQIRELQYKSVFERRKLRADRYVENQKYANALLEYRKILQMEEECRKNPVLCGNIWHNQGTVLARLFLFDEARKCFETAYKHHMKIESIYAAIAACMCLKEESEVQYLARKYKIEKQEVEELREKWNGINDSEEIAAMAAQIDDIFAQEGLLEENPAFMQMLSEWKAEYQKNCK